MTVVPLAACLALIGPKTVVAGAKRQLVHPARYCPDYIRMPYPGGDVPADRGACVDVIIRALRFAGRDLQRLIHQDIRRRWATYPRREAHPDANIDHRRVPNQMHFFARYGERLPLAMGASWKPGDFVFWKLPSGLDHCGVVSDRRGPRGLPMVIHNLSVTTEEDVLDRWRITGHFRYPGPGSIARKSH